MQSWVDRCVCVLQKELCKAPFEEVASSLFGRTASESGATLKRIDQGKSIKLLAKLELEALYAIDD